MQTEFKFRDDIELVECIFSEAIGNETNTDVSVNSLLGPVIDWPHSELVFIYPEGFLNLPQPSVSCQNFACVFLRHIRYYAMQAIP
ncbi:MAG: hypothetical protein WC966_05835 [Bradymonadales bacterium]